MFKRFGIILVLFFVCFISFPTHAATKVAKRYGVPALSREDFNRLSVLNGLPFFWKDSGKKQSNIRPGNLVPMGRAKTLSPYVEGGRFTDKFKKAYLGMVEFKRIETVTAELNAGRPTVVENNFKSSSKSERQFIGHIVKAGRIIDQLYQDQKGGLKYLKDIPKRDEIDRALFDRNMGPWCGAPKTRANPFCNAVASFPIKVSNAYPSNIKQNEAMCKMLWKKKNGKELMNPFTVVRKKKGKFVALSLTEVYGDRMKKVAIELRGAAAALPKKEKAFKLYLIAAASGFETNDWDAADIAWADMNSRNSKWYLRIAPDETYYDPCQEKAGFHVSFAKNDMSSIKWQDKLNPLRQEMEQNMADLIGPDYAARKVAFEFPDFIEMILNSGDSRHNLGATIGQSLPNWGPVAEEGRRRTVVMTNLYTDPDSKRIGLQKTRLLLDPKNMKYYTDDREAGLLAIILHEATHNFGPHTDHLVGGKSPSQIFGGAMGNVLEELKAQTGALWYVDYLRRKGLISDKRAREMYLHEINWCFGHISRGMFSTSGSPKAYSQLSAIQIGTFIKEGAISYVPSTDPKTGETMERFLIDFDKLPAAIDRLMKKAGMIKATGDVAGAKALVDEFVREPGLEKYVHADEIADRILKFSKASFYYSVRY
jgi:hypothetical protein